MTNSVDSDKTVPSVRSGSTLFARTLFAQTYLSQNLQFLQ